MSEKIKVKVKKYSKTGKTIFLNLTAVNFRGNLEFHLFLRVPESSVAIAAVGTVAVVAHSARLLQLILILVI